MSTRADRVRQAIEMTRLPKSAVARELGVTPQSVNGWLKTGKISSRSMADLARLSGVPVSAIMDGPMPPRPLPDGVRELIPTVYRSITMDELQLLELYRACDQRAKEMLLAGLRTFADPSALRAQKYPKLGR